MIKHIFLLLLLGLLFLHAQETATEEKKEHGQPATLSSGQLKDFSLLAKDRRDLIEVALAEAKPGRWLKYKMGAAEPSEGGFDCSGAMYYVMRKLSLQPPRTSADQYEWLRENDRLHANTDGSIKAPDDPFFRALAPGDLLFWGRPAADGGKPSITHVAMYLGQEKRDNRRVMINATDGRSYRGKQANGYGVYDFSPPREGAETMFMGYGTPPGIGATGQPATVSLPEWWTAIDQNDPDLTRIIGEHFTIGKRIGKTTAPLECEVTDKQTGKKQRMTLQKSADHTYTKRFTFSLKSM